MLAINLDDVRHERVERVLSGGQPGWTTSYFGKPPVRAEGWELDPSAEPQAFLVEQSPGSIVRPHFHKHDQYQVIVDGSGRMNRHAIAAPAVHYANADTGYGPIEAGPEGLSYFTLRAAGESGAYYVPEALPELDRSASRRQSTVEVRPTRGLDRCVRALIEPSPDGVAAWHVAIAAGDPTPAVEAPAGAGRFWVGLGGTLAVAGVVLRPLGVMYFPPEELRTAIGTAEADGAEYLVLQLPVAR